MNENPTAALRRAVLSEDHDAINRETERLLQAMAFDLCRVSSKYGSDFHGLLMAAVESYLESLRQIAGSAGSGDLPDPARAHHRRHGGLALRP